MSPSNGGKVRMWIGLIVVVLIAVGLGVWLALFAKHANEAIQPHSSVRTELTAAMSEREKLRANNAALVLGQGQHALLPGQHAHPMPPKLHGRS